MRGLKFVSLQSTQIYPESHPSRVRGLKSISEYLYDTKCLVAPFTGAWIEIYVYWSLYQEVKVAPFTGAWIEIRILGWKSVRNAKSHPSRVRGLKSTSGTLSSGVEVAPFTGAWIEILTTLRNPAITVGRTLHGCVD